ncbi:MAG: glycosyltransferase family 39 protein, partial [Caulobacteraceae bacterium]|nr:glycosyltransferase family 39 protein [Caulobacter sp.]
MLVFALQLVRVADTWSASWDEPHHLYDGYTVWTTSDHRLNPEVPPLVKLAAAAPLLRAKLFVPPNRGRPEPEEAFRDGRTFVFANGPARTLLPARYACMLFALALAGLVAAAAWRLCGPAAAVAALVLATFDPTLLANGPLVTTDVASALFIFAASLAFARAARPPLRLAWLAAAGVAAGCAMTAKFTGVLLAPILLALALWDAFVARDVRVLRRRLLDWAAVLVIAWIGVWAV